jgi:hypothetical protein
MNECLMFLSEPGLAGRGMECIMLIIYLVGSEIHNSLGDTTVALLIKPDEEKPIAGMVPIEIYVS